MGPLPWAPLFSHIFQVAQSRQDYAAYVDLLLRHWFNAEDFGRQAEAWHRLIGPYLTQATGDKMYAGGDAMFTLDQFTGSRKEMAVLTDKRPITGKRPSSRNVQNTAWCNKSCRGRFFPTRVII